MGLYFLDTQKYIMQCIKRKYNLLKIKKRSSYRYLQQKNGIVLYPYKSLYDLKKNQTCNLSSIYEKILEIMQIIVPWRSNVCSKILVHFSFLMSMLWKVNNISWIRNIEEKNDDDIWKLLFAWKCNTLNLRYSHLQMK